MKVRGRAVYRDRGRTGRRTWAQTKGERNSRLARGRQCGTVRGGDKKCEGEDEVENNKGPLFGRLCSRLGLWMAEEAPKGYNNSVPYPIEDVNVVPTENDVVQEIPLCHKDEHQIRDGQSLSNYHSDSLGFTKDTVIEICSSPTTKEPCPPLSSAHPRLAMSLSTVVDSLRIRASSGLVLPQGLVPH